VLSEKPVAENLAEAKDTIAWYRAQKFEVSWCVAENWRFLESFRYASSQVVDLGRLLGFQVRSHMMHQTDFKYYSESSLVFLLFEIKRSRSTREGRKLTAPQIPSGARTLPIRVASSLTAVSTSSPVYVSS
jgi:hypothetical protein